MRADGADAAIMQSSLPRKPAFELAMKYRLPVFGATRQQVEEGALASYSSNQSEILNRVAFYLDRLLKGTKPTDLPVEQPTRYELLINLRAAKALGIKVPDTVLTRADEVIE